MLLGNYSVFNKSPIKYLAGNITCDRSNWNTPGSNRGFYYGDKSSFNTGSGTPTTTPTYPLLTYGRPLGAVPPYSWIIPQEAGGMGMVSYGVSSATFPLVPAYPMLASISGTSAFAAALSAYGEMVCALTGTNDVFSASATAIGVITCSLSGTSGFTATLSATGALSVNFTGTGTLSGTALQLIGMLAAISGTSSFSGSISLLTSMVAAMTGSGTITVGIDALMPMTASFTGSGSITAALTAYADMVINAIGNGSLQATLDAIGSMSIDITVTGAGLTVANVGPAVWGVLQTALNNPGTAGAALLAAGSAGDPWSTLLPGSYTGEQAGQILAQIQTLIDELHKIQGLDAANPMTVTPSARVSGPVTLDITGDGETTTTVTRQ